MKTYVGFADFVKLGFYFISVDTLLAKKEKNTCDAAVEITSNTCCTRSVRIQSNFDEKTRPFCCPIED